MPKKSTYRKNNVEIDDSVFQERVKRLARKFKVDEKQFIKDQSRLYARDAARFTPPFKGFPDWHRGTTVGSKADIEAGESAIKGDIKRICFIVPDKVAMDEKIRSKGRPVYRKGIIVAPGVITNGVELYRWHQQNRQKSGRTTKKLKPPNLPWVGRELANEYIKDMQRHAGVAKAAFYKASLGFGGTSKATPKIKRHLAKTSGSGKLRKTSKGHEGIITATAKGLNHTERFLGHLRRNRMEKAYKRLQILAKEAAKSSGFKVR